MSDEARSSETVKTPPEGHARRGAPPRIETPPEQGAPSPRGKKSPRGEKARRLALKIGLLCGSLLVAFLIAEVGLRLFFPQPLAGVMFSEDPVMGFWNRPNLDKQKFQSEPGCPFYHVTTDANGYRIVVSTGAAASPGTKRVLVLGDSFTFGVGVEDSETFPAVLEGILNRRAKETKPFEVINAGCAGWGTENELAFWRARSEELKPDVLVVAFFINDLQDNMRHLLFRIQDGRPVEASRKGLAQIRRMIKAIPFYTVLAEHSHVVNLLRRFLSARVRQSGPAGPPPQAAEGHRGGVAAGGAAKAGLTPGPKASVSPGGTAPLRPELVAQLGVYKPLMEALMDETRGKNVPLLLLLLPGRQESSPTPPPPYLEVEKVADRWAGEKKVLLINLRDLMTKMTAQGLQVFQPIDGHYNAEGNRLVAETLSTLR